jgi:putative ABC transport system permease protein
MRDWKAVVRARLGPLAVDGAREAEILDELAQHVAQHHAELVASGASDEEALAAALAPLSNPARIALEIVRADRPRRAAPPPPEASSGASARGLMADCIADARYAVRLLRRSPGFAVVALATLAVGLGVNTAIFSVLNAVLLRPLPFAASSRLVMLGERASTGHTSQVGFATFLDWKARTHAFEDLALVRDWTATIDASGEPRRIGGLRVSSNYFRLLGAKPAIGRDFTPAEDDPAHWRVLMLSDGLWRRQFNADPSVVGRVVNISDRDYTIVGVMPRGFDDVIAAHYYRPADAWSLLGYDVSLEYACRSCQHLRAVGRLRAGATAASASSELRGLHEQLRREHPADYPQDSDVAVEPLRSALAGDVSGALTLLMTAVALVLLIACANVANLLLARMASRARDLGLRAALGAGRSRILRQLMTENAVLALLGGSGGIVLTWMTMSAITAMAPIAVTRIATFRVDGPVLAFSAIVSMATAMVFGLLPALRAARPVSADLRLAAHGRVAGGRSPARRLLVAAEVALAVLLLTGAALMVQSVGRLLRVNPGFASDGVLTLRTVMLGRAYATRDQVTARTAAVLSQILAVPGVTSAAAASQIPLGGDGDRYGFHMQERPSENPANDPPVERYGVTPEYFDAMRIPLITGRLFTDADQPTAPMAMIVSRHTARVLFGGEDALGKHVRFGGLEGPWFTIVGIVGDVRHADIGAGPELEMYTCQWQVSDSFLTIVVRGDARPADVVAAMRSAAPDLPVYDVVGLDALVARSIASQRFVMGLLEIFGAIALLLTAVGVYGVIAYTISERTREIGIRLALGAGAGRVVAALAAEGFAVVGAGVTVGLVLAGAAASWLRHDLYGISPRDPATLAMVALTIGLVAAAAHVTPVLRAIRVDPSVVLRQD